MRVGIVFLVVCLSPCLIAGPGPDWDSSGNGLLTGAYNFRHVIYLQGDAAGDLFDAISVHGQIVFDGNGKYVLAGASVLDLNSGTPRKLTASGNYSIASSGFGYLDSPLEGGDRIYALVSANALIGSTTENIAGYNDLFLAAPASQGGPQTFQGTYQVVYFSPSYSPDFTTDAMLQLIADGYGNIAPGNAQGYTGGGDASGFTRSVPGATYTFGSGSGTLSFADASLFATADESFFASPDGSFIVGGSNNGYDIFAGIRIDAAPGSRLSGLYFEAGLDQDVSNYANGVGSLAAWYGSLNAAPAGSLCHRRMNSIAQPNAIGQTFLETSGVDASTISSSGAARIGIGVWPHIGIRVAFAAPAPSGDGVFLNPQGVVNAASSAPFTAGISPGESITLFGSNLASGSEAASSLPLARNLGGVQVLINGVSAPLEFVSPTQVSAVVPYTIDTAIAAIQVVADGNPSNIVTTLVNQTTPGVFTSPAGGISYAVALHGDYSLISAANPAMPGETIAVYVNGLGPVAPATDAGMAGPVSPFGLTTDGIQIDVDGNMAAAPSFAGLAPDLAGLYQLNFRIPDGMSPGDHVLGVSGPDSRSAQALIAVGTGPQ